MASGRFHVLIETDWCKACGICAAFCPTGTLAVPDGEKAAVVNPEACTGCELCARLCPDLAIEIAAEAETA